jgi:hypothetical protein
MLTGEDCMTRAHEIFIERIKNGLCPICNKILDKETVLVEDPVFGEVPVCGLHVLRGDSLPDHDGKEKEYDSPWEGKNGVRAR